METNNLAKGVERVIAASVDYLIHINLILVLFLFVARSSNNTMLFDSLFNLVAFSLLVWLVLTIVHVFLTSRVGGSVGKIVTGLQIVSRKTNNLISFRRAFFRVMFKLVLSAGMFWVGYLWILVHREKLSWHDMAVNTKVVRSSKYGWVAGTTVALILIVCASAILNEIYSEFLSNRHVYVNLLMDITR